MEPAGLPSPIVAFDGREARRKLGAMLVEDGLLSVAQVEEALVEKENSGRRLGEIVVERGWLTSADLGRALAEQYQLGFLDLTRAEVDAGAAALLPERLARRYQALPLRFLEDDLVLVAVADPTNVLTSDDLCLALGRNVRLVVVDAQDLERAFAGVYRSQVELGPLELDP